MACVIGPVPRVAFASGVLAVSLSGCLLRPAICHSGRASVDMDSMIDGRFIEAA